MTRGRVVISHNPKGLLVLSTNLLDDIASRHGHDWDAAPRFNPLTNHVEIAQLGQAFDQQRQGLFGQEPTTA
jgi:hypothetical protein